MGAAGVFFGMQESGWLVVSLLGPVEEFGMGVTELVNYFIRIKVVIILSVRVELFIEESYLI